MSATSITIKNTKQAIIDGIFNGQFNEEGVFRFNNIKYTTSRGNSNWTILVKLLNTTNNNIIPITDNMLEGGIIEKEYNAIIETECCQDNGKIRKNSPTIITSGKHIGSINETNIIEQAFRDALSIYNKKIKSVASNMVTEEKEDKKEDKKEEKKRR